jgi:poly(3-hydroxybutyrate) depolymerase
MLIDTGARFPINPNRLYATGFSGGARVACTMAQSFKVRIAGVIGCAAGPDERSITKRPGRREGRGEPFGCAGLRIAWRSTRRGR